MTRDETLAWAKQRALEHVDRGDLAGAMASFVSDSGKDMGSGGCVDFSKPAMTLLKFVGLQAAASGDRTEMRRWVEGFN